MPGPVLLVHDDIAVIATVRRLLSREGHEVILATSVADAMIAFGHYLPSLLLLAPSVEGDRGPALLEELSRHPDGPIARVVLLGHAVEGVAAPVVSLPLEGDRFLETIRGVLQAGPDAEGWRVFPAPAPPTPPPPHSVEDAPQDVPDEWHVRSPVLEEALFGDLPTETSRFAPLDLTNEQLADLSPSQERAAESSPASSSFDPEVTVQTLPPPLEEAAPPALVVQESAPLEEAAPPLLVREPPRPAKASVRPVLVLGHLPRLSPLPQGGPLTLAVLPPLLASLADLPGLSALAIAASGVARMLWLDGEQVVAVSSRSPGDSLLAQARRDGFIDERQEAQLQPLRFAPPAEAAAALCARGLIRDVEVEPLLEACADARVVAALSERNARFEIRVGEEPPNDALAVARPLPRLLAVVLRAAGWPAKDSLTEQPPTRVVPSPAWELREHFGLQERERRLAQRVDGTRTVLELLEEVGDSSDWPARALGWWEALGLVVREPLEAPDPGGRVAKMESKWVETEEADYFAILGLSRQANRQEVEQAFNRLVEEFSTAQFGGHPDVRVRQRATQLHAAFSEAAEVLRDDRLRAEYARNLLD